MRNTLGRNINMCFPKIKSPEDHHSHPSLPNSTATTIAATSILIKNFNSLYDDHLAFDSTTSHSKSLFHSSNDCSSTDSDAETSTPADLATVFASQRFFFSSPGRSNSIIDSSSPSSSSSPPPPPPLDPPTSNAVVGGGVAVRTFSEDPYSDFRRSMQEMVEARDLVDVRSDWERLHELLTCYLALNPKSTHKFIVRAFSDLLVSLMASPRQSRGRRSEFAGSGCSISRRSM